MTGRWFGNPINIAAEAPFRSGATAAWRPSPTAARPDATAENVADVVGVAILMNGGPGTVHAARVFDALDEDADT
jgi:hypothetical protein